MSPRPLPSNPIEAVEEFEKGLESRHTYPSLKISRMPLDIKARFMKLANSEFCSDYGLTLKFLFDKLDENTKLWTTFNGFYAITDGLNSAINDIMSELADIKNEIDNLKHPKKKHLSIAGVPFNNGGGKENGKS